MDFRVMYLRDSYDVRKTGEVIAGSPVGCVAIRLNGNVAEYQVSTLNPADNFERGVARQLALGRMVEAPFTVRIPKNANIHEITRAVMKDLAKYKSAPARARKAAKLWLKVNS